MHKYKENHTLDSKEIYLNYYKQDAGEISQKISNILLIEDDIDHAELIMEELETLNIENEIILLKDGQEAIA